MYNTEVELSWTYVGFTSVQFAHLRFPSTLYRPSFVWTKMGNYFDIVSLIVCIVVENFDLQRIVAKPSKESGFKT